LLIGRYDLPWQTNKFISLIVIKPLQPRSAIYGAPPFTGHRGIVIYVSGEF